MEKDEIRLGVMTVNDPLGDVLDIISFNEYVGWYDGDSEKCETVSCQFSSDKPVFICEFGAGALYGHHRTTPWILKDFRSPRRQVPYIQDDFNRKDLISDKGQRKKAFYLLRDWYDEIARNSKTSR